jgi:hypothetical protein
VDYSAEQAGSATASWASSQERLRRGLRGVEVAIDLRQAVTVLNHHQKRQVAHFIVDNHQPGKLGGRYVDPVALATQVAVLHAQDRIADAAVLSREIREIRTCRAVAVGMSGRRARAPLSTRADRRLRGKPCARCSRPIRLGQAVFHDRDWGSVWHEAGGCHE